MDNLNVIYGINRKVIVWLTFRNFMTYKLETKICNPFHLFLLYKSDEVSKNERNVKAHTFDIN